MSYFKPKGPILDTGVRFWRLVPILDFSVFSVTVV